MVSLFFFVAVYGFNSGKGDSLFKDFASREQGEQKLGAKPEFDPFVKSATFLLDKSMLS